MFCYVLDGLGTLERSWSPWEGSWGGLGPSCSFIFLRFLLIFNVSLFGLLLWSLLETVFSDLGETWGTFFLEASRSILYSSGTLYPSGKHENEGKIVLLTNQKTFLCFLIFPLKGALYAQMLILVNLIVVNLFSVFNSTRNGRVRFWPSLDTR